MLDKVITLFLAWSWQFWAWALLLLAFVIALWIFHSLSYCRCLLSLCGDLCQMGKPYSVVVSWVLLLKWAVDQLNNHLVLAVSYRAIYGQVWRLLAYIRHPCHGRFLWNAIAFANTLGGPFARSILRSSCPFNSTRCHWNHYQNLWGGGLSLLVHRNPRWQ